MKKQFFTYLLLAIPAGAVAQTAKTDTIPVASYDLDSLEVVATRSVVKSDGANLTYDVSNDISSKGLTVSDMLRKVPMVSVDGEGNIRINGDSNFKIYVNGKENTSLTANYKEIFKTMPAETIVKVEVITEPGAKFDAEGTAGILNLITIRKNNMDGYAGSVAMGIGLRQSNISANTRMQKGKWAFNVDVTYADNGLKKQKVNGEMETENFSSDLFSRMIEKRRQITTFNVMSANLGLSYDLSQRDILSVTASYDGVRAKLREGSYEKSLAYDKSGKLISMSSRLFGVTMLNKLASADATWHHDFNDKGNNIVISYRYDYGLMNMDVDMKRTEQEGIVLTPAYQLIYQNQNTNEHTLQLDWTNPMSDGKHSVEAGGKAVWRHNPVKSSTLEGDSPSSAAPASGSPSDMTQFQNIGAIYGSYKLTVDKFVAMAGIRFEHTHMGINFKSGGYKDFASDLNDLVPNASLTWMCGPVTNLRLAYQMRISRPGINQVNPYEIQISPQQVQTGNPELSSAKANKITLTFSDFKRTLGYNFGIEYSTISNAIQMYAYNKGDVIYQTYANIGRDDKTSFFGMLSWTIIPQMQMMINGRLYHSNISSKSPDYNNKGWSLNYGASWNYSLPNKIRLSVYGGQQTKRYELQGYRSGYYYYGIGINKNLLRDDALSVGISANEFLSSSRSFHSYFKTGQSSTSSTFHNQSGNVSLSISWNFGNLKSNSKKIKSSSKNDDVDKTAGTGIM